VVPQPLIPGLAATQEGVPGNAILRMAGTQALFGEWRSQVLRFGSRLNCSALEAQNVSYIRGRTAVLRDLNLTVACGDIVALLGANGVGKTTLLECLAGVLRPTGGGVHWFGEAGSDSTSSRRWVGFLGHESSLYHSLTAWENLHFAGRMYGLDQPEDRVEEVLSSFQLKSHAHRPTGSLSRGMRQRLAIARAMLHEPVILMLDEPFTSLDDSARDSLEELLRAMRRSGMAILMTSHDPAQSRNLADRIFWLREGRLFPDKLSASA